MCATCEGRQDSTGGTERRSHAGPSGPQPGTRHRWAERRLASTPIGLSATRRRLIEVSGQKFGFSTARSRCRWDLVTARGEEVTARGEEVTAGGDLVTAGGEEVAAGGEEVAAGGEEVAAGGEEVAAGG